MSDLISRSALIEAMEKKYDVAKQKAFYSVGLAEGFIVCEEIIKEQQTVEAVPVVRCKDCKHSDLPAVLTLKYGKPGTLTCHNSHSPCNNRNVDKEDFCSRGEVMEGADMRKKVE